jgi:hypothetical protein
MSPVIPILVMLWLSVSPLQTPPLATHSVVIRLALGLSGHTAAFTRTEMLSNYKKTQQGAP